MINTDFSKNMHLHTEREGAYFPQNSINEIILRYNFAINHCIEKSVLEIGPGTGFGSKNIIEKSKKYKCIEYSKENYVLFKEKYPDIEIFNDDFLTIDILSDKFECIISMANIYYFNFNKFLSKCSSYLKNDGRLIFCTTNVLHKNFVAAPFSTKYYKLSELKELLHIHQYQATFYGAFKNGKEMNKNKLANYLKLLFPQFLIKFIKIITKKNIMLTQKKNLKKHIHNGSQIHLVDNDYDSKDYVVLYCVAKKL